MSLSSEQVKTEWDKADKDKSGTLDFKEVVSLLDKLNLKLKSKDIKKRFKEVDADGNKNLDFEEFQVFLDRLRTRPEVAEIFDKFADKNGSMPPELLVKFLQLQKDHQADLDTAKKLIAQFEKKVHDKDEGPTAFSVSGFASWLTSKEHNSIFDPRHSTVFQEMNQPFAHYWIASSHNTYLLGDQLAGESSVQAYINAFNLGCRCVELDCWDNTNDITEPIIYHGHTLTSKITFREVVETVRDHGFTTTEYPVILSLEVHCGVEGQKAMAHILSSILGPADMLPAQCAKAGSLPPPSDLKRKVLLKGKMMSTPATTDKPENVIEMVEEEEEDESEDEQEEQKSPKSGKKGKEEKTKENKRATLKAEEEKKKEEKKKDKKKVHAVAQELSDIIHLRAVGFPGFETYKTKNKAWEMSSFVESKVTKFSGKNAADYVEYNRLQVSRIYPKGVRIDSSNYDPVPSWCLGAQIVALNYQTGSEPMWTNVGKFQENGGCGYILKPAYMITEGAKFDPTAKIKAIKTFEITIVSGWQFPKTAGKETKSKGEVIDPYVIVSINGLQADKKVSQTKVIKNNGFNPIWNGTFKFSITNADLATVTFIVMDSDLVSKDDFIAQYSLPLSCLRSGYHTVPLKDQHGKLYENSSLLIFSKLA